MKMPLIVVACATIIGCTATNQKEEKVIEQRKAPTLFIQNIDLSRSTSHLTAYNDSSIARSIYYTIARLGGGTIKVIYITSTSLNEEVITIPVLSLDSLNLDTIHNSYLRNKAIRESQKAKVKFHEQAEVNIQKYIAAICKPHDQDYSDVNNAIALTAITVNQSNYQNYRKIVAIFSDLKHCPKNKKDNKLSPVRFNNTTVLCVRPELNEEQINKLFSQNVHVLTSSEDIHSFIQSNHSN